MSRAARLVRVIGLQKGLASVRLAQARAAGVLAEKRVGLLDDLAKELMVEAGVHQAAHLAAQDQMAHRLRAARQASVESAAAAAADCDRFNRACCRLDIQHRRVNAQHAADGLAEGQTAPALKRRPTG